MRKRNRTVAIQKPGVMTESRMTFIWSACSPRSDSQHCVLTHEEFHFKTRRPGTNLNVCNRVPFKEWGCIFYSCRQIPWKDQLSNLLWFAWQISSSSDSAACHKLKHWTSQNFANGARRKRDTFPDNSFSNRWDVAVLEPSRPTAPSASLEMLWGDWLEVNLLKSFFF